LAQPALLASLSPLAETSLASPSSPCVGGVSAGVRFPFWFAPSELVPFGYPPRAAHFRTSGATETLPPCYHPPLNSPLKPPPPSSMALKPLTPALTPATPPRCSLDPYKRRAPPPGFTAPLPASLLFSPRSSIASTERRRLQFCTAVTWPPRRPSTSGEALDRTLASSSSFLCSRGELP
jgi:hypothetical protein